MDSVKKLLKNEYIYSIFTRFITITISLCQSVLVARYLGASLKGTSTYIKSITSIGAIIITFGMHQAYPYFRKKYGKDKIFIDYINAVRGVFIVAFFIILGISCFINNIEIKAAIILIPIMGFADVLAYVCMIENPNNRNKWWTIIYILELCFVIILMFFTKASIFTSIILLCFADVLKILIYSIILNVRIQISKKSLLIVKEMALFGFFPMIALLMTTLNYRIDVIMLRMFPNITDSMIGVYSIGINVAEKIVLVPDTLKGILASKLSKGAKVEEVAKVCRLCLIASIIICCILLAIGNFAIRFLYGVEYKGAYTILIISAFGAIFIGYFKLIAQYNIINGKQIYNVIILSVSIVINVFGNILLVPQFGINGAASATGLGHIVCGSIFVVWFCKKTRIPIKSMILISVNDLKMIGKIAKVNKNDNS